MATKDEVSRLDKKLRKKKLGDLAYKLEKEYSGLQPTYKGAGYDDLSPRQQMKKSYLNPEQMKENVLGYTKEILSPDYKKNVEEAKEVERVAGTGGRVSPWTMAKAESRDNNAPDITDILKNISQLKRRKEDPSDISDMAGVTTRKSRQKSAIFGGENRSFGATRTARDLVEAEKDLKKKSSVLGRLRGLMGYSD